MRRSRPRRRRGFTLMEVLLVLVILVILGSMVGIFVRRAQQQALDNAARGQIGSFKGSVEFFQQNMRRYPTSEEGLIALREPPDDNRRWNGPYTDAEIPPDPWDNEYNYELLDQDNFRIWSNGPDGVSDTDDDISSDALQF
jgi:general secretion pathway protein G